MYIQIDLNAGNKHLVSIKSPPYLNLGLTGKKISTWDFIQGNTVAILGTIVITLS